MAAAGDQLGLTERWAIFASQIHYGQLPARLVPVLKGILLDTIGVSLAATTLGGCRDEVMGLVRANAGTPESLILGHGERVSSLMSALANGTFAHALNFDAMGARGGHIGVAAVPAPLIMAERRGGVSGEALLAALAIGAEFTTRIAESLMTSGVDMNEKFLEGQLLGFFGASLAAGRVCDFTPEKMHNLLGLALMQSSGTRQVSLEGGAGKALAGGLANHGAILAVLLADQGIDAKCAALEGKAGFYNLFYGGRYTPSIIGDGLGDHFYAQDTAFKPWPTSGILHPFIDACRDLRGQHEIDPSAIATIKVVAGPPSRAWLEPVDERRFPRNGATAANSIFFAVARTLAHGGVYLEDFSTEGMSDPLSLTLAGRISYDIDGEIGSGALVRVEMQDGSVITASSAAGRGQMTFDELSAKFRLCARHAAHPVSEAAVEEFIDRVANLEREADIGSLLAVLGGKTDIERLVRA